MLSKEEMTPEKIRNYANYVRQLKSDYESFVRDIQMQVMNPPDGLDPLNNDKYASQLTSMEQVFREFPETLESYASFIEEHARLYDRAVYASPNFTRTRKTVERILHDI